jgi:hypothetical protein
MNETGDHMILEIRQAQKDKYCIRSLIKKE